MIAIKNSLIGVPKSEEHRKKIGDAIRGIVRSDEYKKNFLSLLKIQLNSKKQLNQKNLKTNTDKIRKKDIKN